MLLVCALWEESFRGALGSCRAFYACALFEVEEEAQLDALWEKCASWSWLEVWGVGRISGVFLQRWRARAAGGQAIR